MGGAEDGIDGEFRERQYSESEGQERPPQKRAAVGKR